MMTDHDWRALFFEACDLLQIIEATPAPDGGIACDLCGGSPRPVAIGPRITIRAGRGHAPDCDLGRLMAIRDAEKRADRPR
jgi:hypothetical protein